MKHIVEEVKGKDITNSDMFWLEVEEKWQMVSTDMLNGIFFNQDKTYLVRRLSTTVTECYTKEQMEDYAMAYSEARFSDNPLPPLPSPITLSAIECYVPVSVKDRLPKDDGWYHVMWNSSREAAYYDIEKKTWWNAEDEKLIGVINFWLEKRTLLISELLDEQINKIANDRSGNPKTGTQYAAGLRDYRDHIRRLMSKP